MTRAHIHAAWPSVAAMLVILAAIICGILRGCETAADAGEPTPALVRAIHMVEASGSLDPPDRDGGRSIGPLQIQRGAWADGCQYGRVGWEYTLARSLPHAARVFWWYTSRYGARTDEERARCWNSGPKWSKKYRKTNEYWRRVQAELAKGEPT